MRLTDAERHLRLCSAILEALTVNGGWLSREQLRLGLGQGYVEGSDLDAALIELRMRGLILAKKRRKGVGRHGRPRTVYATATARLVLFDDTSDPVAMSTAIALDPAARAALFDYARTRYLAARADAQTSLEDEAFWRTTAIALRESDQVIGPADATEDEGEAS